jgi:hypothetical protein
MEAITHLLVYSFLFSLFKISITQDTLTPSQSTRDDGTLVSAGGSFQLGFFNPSNSRTRYLGIWYIISSKTVVWVANRDAPLNDHSGVLKVIENGVLVLLNVKGEFTHKLQQAVCSATQANQLVHSQPRKETPAHLQLEESSCASLTNSSSSSTHNSSLKAAD